MLPEGLLGDFSPTEAIALGAGQKALRRLRQAGLLVETPAAMLRLVQPVDSARVALAAVGPPAALCGLSAAQQRDWQLLRDPRAVHVVVPPNRWPACWPGTAIHRWRLRPGDLADEDGIRITTPLRTALDVAAQEPLADAVAVLDHAIRIGAVPRSALLDAVGPPTGNPGHCQAFLAVALSDAARESVYESLFYVLVHQARLRLPRCQYVITRGGRFVGRVDFAWPERRLVVEIDGYAYHADGKSFARDRRRQNAVVNAGWRVLRYPAVDLLTRPEEVVRDVAAALALPPIKINAAKAAR